MAKSSGAMETLETVDMKHSSGQMVSYLIVNVYLAVVVDWIKKWRSSYDHRHGGWRESGHQ